jgi:geranylgeranyl pyrophosphate synthase
MASTLDFKGKLSALQREIEDALRRLVPPAETRPARLHAAMRYSLEAGGKRLRPVLVLASAELFGAEKNMALPAAVAIECVHTYSLIHDDLPCMDDDDLRRGRPTCHKQFDEATALLAGDALLTLAFELLSVHYSAGISAALVRELSVAAGSRQLIGGQMDDLLAEKMDGVSADDLRAIHRRKTGAMIEAALAMGGVIGDAQAAAALDSLRRAGRHIGLAFQIIDDLLDATADTATLGKTAGKDAKNDKTTFVKLHGLDASRRFAREESDAAIAALRELPGDTEFLVALVRSMETRAS